MVSMCLKVAAQFVENCAAVVTKLCTATEKITVIANAPCLNNVLKKSRKNKNVEKKWYVTHLC